jgi:hypothetical protein
MGVYIICCGIGLRVGVDDMIIGSLKIKDHVGHKLLYSISPGCKRLRLIFAFPPSPLYTFYRLTFHFLSSLFRFLSAPPPFLLLFFIFSPGLHHLEPPNPLPYIGCIFIFSRIPESDLSPAFIQSCSLLGKNGKICSGNGKCKGENIKPIFTI